MVKLILFSLLKNKKLLKKLSISELKNKFIQFKLYIYIYLIIKEIKIKFISIKFLNIEDENSSFDATLET